MKRIAELEGLRGLLAVWVVLFHVLAITRYIEHPVLDKTKNIIDGSHAVDVFIILSGFMITMLILTRQEPYRVYLLRRFLRLYPVYICCVLVAFWLIQIRVIPANYSHHDALKHLSLHAVMLHGVAPKNFLPQASGAILNPAWSISLEWQFYVIAPVILFILNRFKTLGFTLLITFSFAIYYLSIKSSNWDGAFLGLKLQLFWIGIISFLIYRWTVENRPELQKLTQSAPVFILYVYLIFFLSSGNIGILVWSIVYTMILSSQIIPKSKLHSFLLETLASSVLQWLGKVSYSIYLIHEIVIWGLLFFMAPIVTIKGLIILVTLTLIITFAISSLTYKYIEAPAARIGKKQLINRGEE